MLLNYNGERIRDTIEEAVRGVRAQSYPHWELLIVDDGSTDASPQFLRRLADGDQIRFLPAKHRGVGAARNVGVMAAQGSLLCFLDNDAVPDVQWLEQMVGLFSEDPDLGAAASFVEFADRPGVVNSAGSVLNELAYGMGVCMHELAPFCRPPEEVMYPTGNGMVVRREALRRVGGFDEAFRFWGHDDSDLGIRLRNLGYRIRPSVRARVRHLHSVSKQQPGMSYWDLRNRLLFALKHYQPSELPGFVRADVRGYLRGPAALQYAKAWSSALGAFLPRRRQWSRLRPAGRFLDRFAPFFAPEARFVVPGDNRDRPLVITPVGPSLRVGADDGQHLYQGWYPPESQGGTLLRWAMPVASILGRFDGWERGIRLDAVPPPGVSRQSMAVECYEWSSEWWERRPLQSLSVELTGAPFERLVLELSREALIGERLLVFRSLNSVCQPALFPRRLGWGLRAIGSA